MRVMFAKKSISTRAIKFIFATAVCAVVNSPQVHAQNLISNGGFEVGANGLTDWTQASWAGGSSFGINANGPANTSAASGNYAYAGGGAYNLLQQNISGITAGNSYRLTFLAGSKSGQGNANGVLSLLTGWRAITTAPASITARVMPCSEVTPLISPHAGQPLSGSVATAPTRLTTMCQ